MQCPVCQIGLEQTDLGDHGFIILDICPTCKGTWFDKGELDKLDDSIWVNVEEHAFHEVDGDHKDTTCPKCQVPLQAVSPPDMPDLIIDRCSNCDGFWLDNGELDRVIDVASKDHDELLKSATIIQRPSDWSWLKWTVYKFKKR